MTRHELKEQLQHDAFRDNIGNAVGYVATHKQSVLRWVAVAAGVLVIAGIIYGVLRYQKANREQALRSAMEVLEAPVSNQADSYGKTYPTQQAKDAASIKAFSDVAARYDGSDEGALARYMLAGLQAANGKYSEAEKNFKQVASSGSPAAALAKVGLAQLYAGQGQDGRAKDTLQNLVANPSPLVSKEQATVLLANVVKPADAKRAKQLLDSLKPSAQRPALERAVEQVNNPTR